MGRWRKGGRAGVKKVLWVVTCKYITATDTTTLWLQNTYKALLPAAPAYAEKTGFPEAHSCSSVHSQYSSLPYSFTHDIGNHHSLSLLIWGLVWKIKKKHFSCVKYFCDYIHVHTYFKSLFKPIYHYFSFIHFKIFSFVNPWTLSVNIMTVKNG